MFAIAIPSWVISTISIVLGTVVIWFWKSTRPKSPGGKKITSFEVEQLLSKLTFLAPEVLTKVKNGINSKKDKKGRIKLGDVIEEIAKANRS